MLPPACKSVSRRRHPAARPDRERHRRSPCLHGVAHERELQGTRSDGVSAPARTLPHETAPARHSLGVWPETAAARSAQVDLGAALVFVGPRWCPAAAGLITANPS